MKNKKKDINSGVALPTVEEIKSEIITLKQRLKEFEQQLKQKKLDLIAREANDKKEFNAKTGEAINVAFPDLTPEQILELINVGLKIKEENKVPIEGEKENNE